MFAKMRGGRPIIANQIDQEYYSDARGRVTTLKTFPLLTTIIVFRLTCANFPQGSHTPRFGRRDRPHQSGPPHLC